MIILIDFSEYGSTSGMDAGGADFDSGELYILLLGSYGSLQSITIVMKNKETPSAISLRTILY